MGGGHGVTEEMEAQVVTDERDRELGVIAAAHAALDPKRRAQRADILVESILQVLRKGPLPEERILQEIQRLWHTQSITAPLIRSGLVDARAANLVVPQDTLIGIDWTVTGEGLRDTQEDALWAQSVLDRFEAEVRSRIEDDPNRLLIHDRSIPKIAVKLREALAMGPKACTRWASPRDREPSDRCDSMSAVLSTTSRLSNLSSPAKLPARC